MPVHSRRKQLKPLRFNMSKFSDEYINCLREAKGHACYRDKKPRHLAQGLPHGDATPRLHINTRFKNAKAYLEELKPVLTLIREDFKHQDELEAASRHLHKISTPEKTQQFHFEVTREDARLFFQLLCSAIDEMEKELTKADMLEKAPLYGTTDYPVYMRMISILEAVSCVLTKPYLLRHIWVCLCTRKEERVVFHVGDILYTDPDCREVILETIIWNTKHSFLEAHFKGEEDPFIYKMEIDPKTGKTKIYTTSTMILGIEIDSPPESDESGVSESASADLE